MNFKKIISIFAATAMLSTATIANAAVEYTYDEENGIYWVANVEDVAERTPSIETTKVTKLTSDEVVALKSAKVTDFSGLKLSANSGKYGDTATYSVYKVEGTFKNVGDLVMGYDEDENYAWIKLQNLDASIDCSAIADKIVDSSIHKATDATTNVAWTGGMNKSTGIFSISNQLGTDNAIPKEEGLVANTDYTFAAYFVVEASEGPITMSYSTANAVVGYNASGNLVPVKPAVGTITLGEKAPDPVVPDEPETDDTVITGDKVQGTEVTGNAGNKGIVWENIVIKNVANAKDYTVTFQAANGESTTRRIDLNNKELADATFAVILNTVRTGVTMVIDCTPVAE